MNILMISSEALPFSKTGGLADVAYSLSKEYVAQKEKVSIITPFYKNIEKKVNKKLKKIASFKVKMNWREPICNVYLVRVDGIDYYLLQNQQYFERDNGLYGYFDDGERYAFFSLASIELAKILPFTIDVIHVHDWQGAIIPCLLKIKYNNDPVFNKIKTVLTIHNPAFKGYLNRESLFDLFNLPTDIFDNGKVRLEGQVSTLKAGITYSDKITTVSPTHRNELLSIEGSKGLWYDLSLREKDFVGIINGMDYKEFNPAKDKIIYNNFKISDVDTEKYKNKVEFCKENGLNPELPLFAVVSRLTDQKGLGVMGQMADFVIHEGGNFAILGSGEAWAHDYFNNLYMNNKNNMYVYIGYNDEIAHKLYAASDFFIMPSAFEPCGLGQMIAHRYGSLPIVRRTGGLFDSVIPINNDNSNYKEANGIGFYNLDVMDSLKAVTKALILYSGNKDVFKAMRKNAMKTDHTWKIPAKDYLNLYNSINK